jgi:hypothetical protein
MATVSETSKNSSYSLCNIPSYLSQKVSKAADWAKAHKKEILTVVIAAAAIAAAAGFFMLAAGAVGAGIFTAVTTLAFTDTIVATTVYSVGAKLISALALLAGGSYVAHRALQERQKLVEAQKTA